MLNRYQYAMDLRKLKAFLVVAEELNFRKSAEILGMSQPPLTRLISALEDELSTQLFERTTRTVNLTGAGVFLLKEARELVARSEMIETELRVVGKQRSGNLNVAFSTTAFLASLPRIIQTFRDRFPKITLDLHQESRRGMFEGLKSARFDACFLEGEPEAGGFDRHLVHDEVLGVLLPKRHRFAKRKSVALHDLKDETLIVHPRREQQAFFDTISHLCLQSGFKPRTYVKKENESCPVLVAIGKGVSLTIAGSQGLAAGETAFVPIRQLYLPVSVFWVPGHSNPSLKGFLSFVVENRALRRRRPECLWT
jgi:LysR family transcriptional regulator, benzoate and cis,cis-muconate-responsive activator of ben and cat genes